MASLLKRNNSKVRIINKYCMLLMVENGIRGGICQATYRYAKANNKYMINYDNKNESSYIEYLDANNLYGWAMSQKTTSGWFQMDRKIIKI